MLTPETCQHIQPLQITKGLHSGLRACGADRIYVIERIAENEALRLNGEW
jgi:hypothetical protein